jgi:hypothetical protein
MNVAVIADIERALFAPPDSEKAVWPPTAEREMPSDGLREPRRRHQRRARPPGEAFFRAVSFEEGATPAYDDIHALFIESGPLIKNVATTPEISTVRQFIEPRQAQVRSGDLTRFREVELWHTHEIFGRVAHRFSAYAKFGSLKGAPFEARGMISTQFVLTPEGWKMSSMAWDDERPGLPLPAQPEDQRAA